MGLNQFRQANSIDDLCLLFCLYPSSDEINIQCTRVYILVQLKPILGTAICGANP